MRILVLGSGAREHALVSALLRDRGNDVTAAPGNAGIALQVPTVSIDANDPKLVSDFVEEQGFDLVVIGPEAPLAAGVADALRARNAPVFGPNRGAAEIESSKAFAKAIMQAAGVPTGRAVHATTMDDVTRALDEYGAPYVVKADGLAAGKGVMVTDQRADAEEHAHYWLQYGPVLIEEFLDGPEVSLFCITDGETVVPLAPAQDFKRLLDDDEGPNTGGMGAYSPLPWLNERFGSEAEFTRHVVDRIAAPTVRALADHGTPFQGLLYCGLIVTADGLRVIEFNARFGDPETQSVLARLTSPLAPLLLAATNGTLADQPAPEFTAGAAVTIVLASDGYPDAPQTGRDVTGLEAASAVEGVEVLHAATARASDGHGMLATGGRVLSVVGTGDSIAEARERAYDAISQIGLSGGQYRRDIAERAAAEQGGA